MQNLSNENIIHVKKGNIEYLQFRKLLEFDNISHAFSLKLDFGSNDTFENKKEECLNSYKILCDCLNLNYKNIVRSRQTHTNIVKNIDTNMGIFHQNLNDVDGLITNKKELILSLVFADCIPIYLYDPKNNVIGNIHSGWKGTFNTISAVAVEHMQKQYNTNIKDLICCIGPSICKKHFEVDEDLANKFLNKFKYIKDINKIITKGRVLEEKQKYNIDTNLINQRVLEYMGVKTDNIIQSNICTVCNKDILHSYRAMGESAGRNTSLICIK